jgi:uncharacterized protein
VTDTANLLDAGARDQLDARLEAYERTTGRQVIVWIGTTIGDQPLEEWSAATFKLWGLGQKKLDNGVAVFILATDHKIRIEVGYGLEDRLTDAYASRIIRDVLAPALQTNTAAAGIGKAIDQITAYLDSVPDARPEQPRARGGGIGGMGIGKIILFSILGLALLAFGITHPRMALWFLWSIMSSIGRGGGGSGGGGGFSGGGGRSGGGGASGSW